MTILRALIGPVRGRILDSYIISGALLRFVGID